MSLTKHTPEKVKTTKQAIVEQRRETLGAFTTKQIIAHLLYRHRVGLLTFGMVSQPIALFAVFIIRANV